jgi:hypothetical protein|tara:strand:+ start:915 stop:1442 length:528 start_codon:yes stop_codon:yes gene_type:complete
MARISQQTIAEAAAAAGGGKLLQVQSSGRFVTTASTTNTSLTDVGFSDTITCASSSNKVLVMMVIDYTLVGSTENHWHGGNLAVVRTPDGGSGTEVYDQQIQFRVDSGSSETKYFVFQIPIMFVDSPSSTAELTYKLQHRRLNDGSNYTTSHSYVNYQGSSLQGSHMHLIEIDGT